MIVPVLFLPIAPAVLQPRLAGCPRIRRFVIAQKSLSQIHRPRVTVSHRKLSSRALPLGPRPREVSLVGRRGVHRSRASPPVCALHGAHWRTGLSACVIGRRWAAGMSGNVPQRYANLQLSKSCSSAGNPGAQIARDLDVPSRTLRARFAQLFRRGTCLPILSMCDPQGDRSRSSERRSRGNW